MSVKSKHTVTKLNGMIYIAGEPKLVGKLPVRGPAEELTEEEKELMEEAWAVLEAGDENN